MHTTTPMRRSLSRPARVAIMAVIATLLAVVAVPALTSSPASAHGWITSPPSRQDHCAAGTTSFDCGQIAYEPQSVEAPKGSLKCSGDSGYAVLDDESLPWPRTQTGTDVTFQWKLTAAHSTSTWEYFVDGELFATYDQGGQQPPSNIQHTLTGLPQGDHTLLARWNVADTAMAFYNCVDLTIGQGGPDPDPTPDPEPTPDPTDPTDPAECAPAWNADTVYDGGQTVSYNGSEWSAKWWTQGEAPGGQWGPWNDLGECGTPSSPEPTTDPEPTSTPSPTQTTSPTPTQTATPEPTSTSLPTCSSPDYESGRAYVGGDTVLFDGQEWKARWWNQAAPSDQPWGPWELQGPCADPR